MSTSPDMGTGVDMATSGDPVSQGSARRAGHAISVCGLTLRDMNGGIGSPGQAGGHGSGGQGGVSYGAWCDAETFVNRVGEFGEVSFTAGDGGPGGQGGGDENDRAEDGLEGPSEDRVGCLQSD